MSHAKSLDKRLIEGHPNSALLKPTMTATGRPVRPLGMGSEGAKLWDSTVEKLIEAGVATEVDQPALEALCYWWHIYKASQSSLASIDDWTTTNASRAINATSKAWDNFRRLAQQFGLTAQARNSVSAAPQETEVDDFLS